MNFFYFILVALKKKILNLPGRTRSNAPNCKAILHPIT